MGTELIGNDPGTDLILIQIVREIAINHHSIESILKRYGVSDIEWKKIRESKRFTQLLESETVIWQSATNTHERTKLKAASLIEEWLPEANKLMHNPEETLPARVELGKLVARIAGMGLNSSSISDNTGEKFSITINLGADKNIKFEKEIPARVIEVND